MSVSSGGSVADEEDEDVTRRRRRTTRRTPPTSLTEYAQSRNYSSVTDLVSPVWCEYAFQYKLLGQGHLPVSERPEEIKTPQGNIVKVNIEIAQQRDKILVAGRQVHKRLEKEIHPVRVRVQTTTKEDAWGLRLLQLITGLKILMDSGCCRELPVFGFVEGRLVFGVIDEVKLHHDKTAASGSSLAKKYSSQEEWKKKSSQQKKKAKQDSSQKSLAAFLPGVKTLVEDRIDQEDKKGNGIYGFILEDAKTRLSMSMPEEKDQTQSKLQCMVYKRLLEGLILGMANNTKGAKLDEYTTPVTPELLCLYLDLESAVPFSDAFMSDASELCEGFNLPIKVVQQEDRSWSCNLMHLFALLSITLDDFVKMAREGTVNKDDYFVIQNELRLTYRRRGAKLSNSERTRSRTKEPRQHNRRVQPSRRALSTPAPGATSILDLLQGNKSVEDLDEEAQVDMALQMSLDDASKEEEEELLADTTVAMPSTPQKSSKSRDTIIGTVRFEHDAQQLQEHLIDVMAMWQGKRALRGVKVDQTWRCNHCEYQTGCEWRQMKADESLQRSLEKRQAQEDLAMWSQLDDLPDEMEW